MVIDSFFTEGKYKVMKTIIIATMGSRGDVEPYIALETELKKIGYDENS